MKNFVFLLLLLCSVVLVFGQANTNGKEVNRKSAMAEIQTAAPDYSQPAPEPVADEQNEPIQIPDVPIDGTRATRTASVSGYWNATATWGGSAVPVAGDAVTINSGITVTVTAAAACTSITFAAVNASSAITISGTNTLTVSGLISMPRPAASTLCTINVNAGTVSCGSLTMNATTTTGNDVINITTGTMTVTGTITTGTTGCQFKFTAAGTLNMGVLSGTPTLTTFAGSTVNYTGSTATTVLATTYLGNLGFSGAGTKTIAASAAVQVNGNITNSSNLVLTAGTSTTATRFYLVGNFTNNTGATFTSTADYTTCYFLGTTAQTFTNDGTVTAPLFTLALGNLAGLTMLGSNQVACARVNLYYGTITNSNKISLGNGGTTSGVVQISSNTSNPRGYFDQAPVFNAGDGGYQLLYAPASVDYSTSYEVPTDGQVAYLLMVATPRTVTMTRDITVPYVYTTGLNLSSGNLSIGTHTLTIEGTVAVTAGTLTGGTSSNITYTDTPTTILPAVSGGLNNLRIDPIGDITMTGNVTVNGTLTLAWGTLYNGSYLTMASGTTIERSSGSLYAAPTFAGTVNLVYTGASPITATKELPTGASVLNNLTTNAGGFTQFNYNINSTALLTEPFVTGLTGWTGAIASATSMKFYSSATTNAGGTSPEVRYYSTETTHADVSNVMYKTAAVSTAGYSYVNISFKSMASGNYIQNYPTYIKLQTATSTSGPWHDAWSYAYSPHSASDVAINNYTADVGGSMYLQFAFVGDPYALDYWYFDNLVVNGVTVSPLTSSITVNGSLNLVGDYTVGSGNTITMANNATIDRSTGALSEAPTFGTNSNLIYSGSTPITTGKEVKAAGVYDCTLNNSAGITLGANMTVGNTLTFTSGAISLADYQMTVSGSISGTSNFIFNGSGGLAGTGAVATNTTLDVNSSTTIPAVVSTVVIDPGTGNTAVLPGDVTTTTLSFTSGSLSFGTHTLTLAGKDFGVSGTGTLSALSVDVSTAVQDCNGFTGIAHTWTTSGAQTGSLALTLSYPTETADSLWVWTRTSGSTGAWTEVGLFATTSGPGTNRSLTVTGFTDLNGSKDAKDITLSRKTYTLNVNSTGYSQPGTEIFQDSVSLEDYTDTTFTASNVNFLVGSYTPGAAPAGYKWSNSPITVVSGDFTAGNSYTVTITFVLEKDDTLTVELSSFTASRSVDNHVNIMWVTQSETGVLGFYVFRNTDSDVSTAQLVTDLIPATNSSQMQVYLFKDTEISEEGTYYYWLQNADLDGTSSFYGPINFDFAPIQGGTTPIPIVTGLKSIYPNPFNPSATISYGLAKAEIVDFTIYNSRGQIVKILKEGFKNAGNYQIRWNGTNDQGQGCSTGVYYIKMRAAKDTFIQKAVLMK